MSNETTRNDTRKPQSGKPQSGKSQAARSQSGKSQAARPQSGKSQGAKSQTAKSQSGKSDIVVKKTYKKKNQAQSQEFVRKSLKHSSGFMFSLLVNVLIVFCLIKIFTMAFHFGYSVFGNVAYHPGADKYVVVDIPADSSVLQVGEALEDADIIESKWVFFAKVKIKNLSGYMRNGQFNLSAAMTYDEILDILCPTPKGDSDSDTDSDGVKLHKVEEIDGASSNEGAGVDYVDPEATTEEGEEAGAEGDSETESDDSGYSEDEE